MNLKLLRQVLKACAEDTRLRIINVLKTGEVPVGEICSLIKAKQSAVSKHLARLRLLKIVIDRREGNTIYYRLNDNRESMQNRITSFINSQFSDIEVFVEDRKEERKVRKK
ncbi:MAG: metalloregulator ArsR/SmtB family transcription factor [Candidatus Omnitrophota bacterium]|nr:metalloregulator ArsR/SmtB family transcription factor [Candidatus Omnitrophota bacterium]